MPRRAREIWAADCETDPFKAGRIPRPFIWGAWEIRSRRYETFSSERTFIDFFRDRKCTVYFHNGGKFDLHYLRPWFNSDQNILLINGRITRAKIGAAEFRDSYSLIPVALGKYQKDAIDYRLLEVEERDKPENRTLIERYLKSDCVNLGDLLGQFFDRYGHALTQAGAAMTYWAKHYNGGKKPRQTAAQFERYKPYYYGGRVECFVEGYRECNFSIVDKNSAYPHAMLHKHPISNEGVLCDRPPSDAVLPACFLTVQCISHGAFPYRLESGELIFPWDDELRTYRITGWEFQAALEANALRRCKILECHWFRQTVDFADYIHYFYLERRAAKANGDKAGDIFAKLFMNSCYGGFAMNPENYHEYMLSSIEKMGEHVEEGYRDYHPWGDGRQLLWRPLPVSTQERMYKNIATAASITGFVRAGLYTDLCRVQHPIDCDTDSIAAEDVSCLSIGTELGQWKVEATCDAYAIAGKKMYAKRLVGADGPEWAYRLGEGVDALPVPEFKVACKGVNLSPQQIVAIAKGETITYTPQVPTYSVTRPEPRFIDRTVTRTAKVYYPLGG